MSELERTVISGLVTLVVGAVLFQVQQGGRRRRLRREIREELDLLDMLPAEWPVRDRLNDRVVRLLRKYEPERSPSALTKPEWLGLYVAMLSVALAAITLWEPSGLAESLAIGGAIGTLGASIAGAIETRRDRRTDSKASS